MTNNQYEKESVERGLKRHDQIIGSLEDALRIAQESRREYVNRHNLNKHECTNHEWHIDVTSADERPGWVCVICNKSVSNEKVMRKIDSNGDMYFTEPDQHSHLCD